MTESKPTLIGEILCGCARNVDARTPDDIILRAAEALGALAAIKNAGKAGAIKVSGIDGLQEALDAVADPKEAV
mgnify:CR=1 FL=1